MSAIKSIWLAALGALILALLIAGFNYAVDPLCFYCEKIELTKSTLNHHYQVAQLVLKHPETEQIILGSSRGETTSPLWLQEKTGLKTLNLSVAAAGIATKNAFIRMSLDKLHLKQVIWYADYFELTDSHGDSNIQNTKALRDYSGVKDSTSPQELLIAKLHEMQALIDHNTIEASLAALKHPPDSSLDLGAGSEINFQSCQSPSFQGKETPESLVHEINLLYDSYSHGVLSKAQDANSWSVFYDLIKILKEHQIRLKIIVIPYNPIFMDRLKVEFPAIYQAHLEWIQKLHQIEGPNIEVVSFLEGIPGDDRSPKYWNDGVHFTCKGAIEMLNKALESK